MKKTSNKEGSNDGAVLVLYMALSLAMGFSMLYCTTIFYKMLA